MPLEEQPEPVGALHNLCRAKWNLLRRKLNLQELLRNLLRNQQNDIKEAVEEPAIEHNDLPTFY